MAQLPLFEQGPRRLLEGASGQVDYLPQVLDATTATVWFDTLMQQVPWRGGTRQMYEREVDVPRLRAHYELDDPALPPVLREAEAAVRARVPAPFTSVGLNLYRDEHDSVAPHNDRLAELVRGEPIALLSLGIPREMVIRAKRPPRRVLRIELEPGSLLVMDWTSQLHYDHAIPKQPVPLAPRISLAFRVRPRTPA